MVEKQKRVKMRGYRPIYVKRGERTGGKREVGRCRRVVGGVINKKRRERKRWETRDA